jgi:uncharacterized coiled-coil protein SlyX
MAISELFIEEMNVQTAKIKMEYKRKKNIISYLGQKVLRLKGSF